MKLIAKLQDYCYYEYKGDLVFVKNRKPYIERKRKEVFESLRQRREIYE